MVLDLLLKIVHIDQIVKTLYFKTLSCIEMSLHPKTVASQSNVICILFWEDVHVVS